MVLGSMYYTLTVLFCNFVCLENPYTKKEIYTLCFKNNKRQKLKLYQREISSAIKYNFYVFIFDFKVCY